MKNLFALSILAAAVAMTACSKKPEETTPATGAATTTASASGATIIKIGHAAPLTGPQAHLGKDNENGVRLAVDELNAKGLTIGGQKVQFELESEDDQADPRIAWCRVVGERRTGAAPHWLRAGAQRGRLAGGVTWADPDPICR